jgi:predicted alpha-1,6-mannanase (GH76 family)
MGAHSQLERLNQVFGKWWRKYIVDECPDARIERLRMERLKNIEQDVALLQAMRLWDAVHRQTQARETEKAD